MYDSDLDFAPSTIEDVLDVELALNDADEDASVPPEPEDDSPVFDDVCGDFWGY